MLNIVEDDFDGREGKIFQQRRSLENSKINVLRIIISPQKNVIFLEVVFKAINRRKLEYICD